jgi:YVTN family beta-propeller protein
MRSRGRDHALATVLFTDIVGSTRIASELGDRRWRALLSRHNAIVRDELRRAGGREIDTAGDGFYASFDEPSRALRCASSIARRVRELGIEIRAGANVGETENIEGKPGGVAVHAASRITALAGPGEVLASSTVRDLVPGSGFTFADRGVHELRDVPGEWHLYALIGIDGTPGDEPLAPEEAAARRSRIESLPRRQRRGARIGVVIAAAVVVLAAAIAIPLALTNSPEGSAKPPASATPAATRIGDRVVRIDPQKGTVTAEYAVGDHPSGVAFGEGSVWVTNANDNTVTRIDPASGKTTTIPVQASPRSITAGVGAIWVGNDTGGSVSRIDPATNTVKTIDLGVGVGSHTIAIAADDATGSVWVSIGAPIQEQSTVLNHFDIGQIDPTTNTFTKTTEAGCCYHAAMAAASGAVWFATDNGTVLEFDARTGMVKWSHRFGATNFYSVTADQEAVWLGSSTQPSGPQPVGTSGGTIWPLDPSTNSLGTPISVGGGPSGIALLGQAVYVSDVLGVVHPYVLGSVLAAIPVGGEATGIAEGEGFLWVSVNAP